MRKVIWYMTACLFIGINTPAAHAGLLDKINAATKKMEEKTQQMNQKNQQAASDRNPDGTCKHRSATCMDYNVTMDRCMDPLHGLRSKLWVEQIENKLKTEELSAEERKNLEEDLAGFQQAVKDKSDSPTIAGQKDSQRYLMDVSEDDQNEVNGKFSPKYQEIMNKCMGADHMGVGHRTEMNYVQDNSEDMAERTKQKRSHDDSMNCLKKISAVRWNVMADVMEERMNKVNPTGKARAEWEGDIASLRAAYDQGLTQPNPVDLENPTRYMTRLTSDDQLTVSNQYVAKSQEEMAKCTATAGDGKIKERPIKSGGLVDKSKSPANKNAKPVSMASKKVDHSKCGALGAGCVDGMQDLTACQAEIGGYRWQVMYSKMMEKFNAEKPKLSGEEIAAWREDLGAVKEAQESRTANVTSPDPNNEYRWQDRLSRAEQQTVNQEYMKLYNSRMKYCNDYFTKMTDHN